MVSCTAPALPGDAPPYERHRSEQTPLYTLVEEHFPRFLERLEDDGVSTRPAVLTQVLVIVYRAISTFLVRRAGLRVGAGARTGVVTLIQPFGSVLNLNPHLHMLFVDGAYTFDDETPRFHRVAAPIQAVSSGSHELDAAAQARRPHRHRTLWQVCRYVARHRVHRNAP